MYYIPSCKIFFSSCNLLFIPYIQYGLFAWGTKYNNVEELQKRVIRLVSGSHHIAHTGHTIQTILKIKC